MRTLTQGPYNVRYEGSSLFSTSARSAELAFTRLVSYNHLISNKREWNNCFIKNAHEISRILPDIIFVKTKDFQLVF